MAPSSEPPEDEEHEDLRSRTETRAATRVREVALERLAKDLVKQKVARLEPLGLSEEVLDAVRDCQLMKSAQAQQRQIRLIRNLLRDTEWPLVRSRLDALVRHGVVPEVGDAAESEWVVRLIGEGGAALDELLRAYPKGDRQHLRMLIRNVLKASNDRRVKAEQALAQCVRNVLRG